MAQKISLKLLDPQDLVLNYRDQLVSLLSWIQFRTANQENPTNTCSETAIGHVSTVLTAIC